MKKPDTFKQFKDISLNRKDSRENPRYYIPLLLSNNFEQYVKSMFSVNNYCARDVISALIAQKPEFEDFSSILDCIIPKQQYLEDLQARYIRLCEQHDDLKEWLLRKPRWVDIETPVEFTELWDKIDQDLQSVGDQLDRLYDLGFRFQPIQVPSIGTDTLLPIDTSIVQRMQQLVGDVEVDLDS